MDDLANSSLAGASAVADGQPETATDKNGAPLMHIKVYSPARVFFDELAASISGENNTGPFDILAHHHNFITLLKACELVIRRPDDGDEQRIKISGGIMHVKADRVTVFLDI